MNKAFSRNKILPVLLAILLSALFVYAAFYSFQGIMSLKTYDISDTSNADVSDRIVSFMLPITIPDNQIMSGTVLLQSKNNIVRTIQPVNKWFFALLFFSILLYGCVVLRKCQGSRLICSVKKKVPEIATRIGGHAPPCLL